MQRLRPMVVPLIVLVIGTAWLLNTLGVTPDIDWLWTIGIALLGIVTFILGGFDKLTFVVGTFLLVASVTSILRQTGRLSVNIEVPVMVIILGALLFIAQLAPIPPAKWLQPIDDKK